MVRLVLILICSGISLCAFAGQQLLVNETTNSEREAKKRIGELLERSLVLELDAIGKSQDQPNPNLSGPYTQQIGLRRFAGEDEQVSRLLTAIASRQSVARNKKQAGQETQWNPRTLTTLIDRGDLQLAWEKLQASSTKLLAASDQPLSNEEALEQSFQQKSLVADHIWLTCKLAAAYNRAVEPERVRDCLNHVRKIQEGKNYQGKEFDADDEWLPPAPTDSRYGSNDQTRLTFYWTLIQTGYPEVAIDWYLANAVSQPEKKVVFGYLGFQSDAHVAFVNNVARFVSPERASKFAEQLYLGLVPREVHRSIAMGSLEVGNFQVAKKHIDRFIDLLPENAEVTDFNVVSLVNKLAETNQTQLAKTLITKLIRRIEAFEAKLAEQDKKGRMPEVLPFYNHGTYAYLARSVVRFDQDLALRLLDLHEGSPQKREFDHWVIAECTRAFCGKITPQKHAELTTSSNADDLIEAYIDSGQLELAETTVRMASAHARKSTWSGSSIGGNKGLGILDFNSYNRILLARRAVFFKDFSLARALLDEMPRGDDRREGYRAVTKMIAETWGNGRAEKWIDETKGALSQSGAILGLVEFLLPAPVDRDNIPNALFGGC